MSQMRFLLMLFSCMVVSCSEESAFTYKNHDVIKSEIEINYQKHKQVFQSLAKEVASFKIIRAINFKNGHDGLGGISVYCDSIDRSVEGYSFITRNLNDSALQRVISEEGITIIALQNVRSRLDQLNCHSFFTLRQSDTIHIELGYNDWNGANHYSYLLFDKRLQPKTRDFFDRDSLVMGQITSTGGVLDSNAVWLLETD